MTIRLPLATIKRILPLLVNVLVTGTILIILELLIDYSQTQSINDIQTLILKIVVLGILNSCSLISIYYFTKELKRWALWMVVLGILALIINITFAAFTPASADALGAYIQRYAILWGTYLTLLVILPIWRLGRTAQAWYFLSRIFIVSLFTVLVTGILEVGLTAGLAALTTLFGIGIGTHTYVILGIIILYMFSQIFCWFLMPGNVDEGLNLANYPKFLLRLTQFGLLPLATVYMVILYAYSLSILITGNLPVNQLVYMVVGFLVPNLFALTFLLPLVRERLWVRIVTIAYAVLSLPLVGLLFYGIVIRIGDVGLSIDRGLVFLLGIWFVFVYLYVLVGKWVKPQIILISLPLLLTFAAFLPVFNIFSLTEASQANRLIGLLSEKGYIQSDDNGEMTLVPKDTLVDYPYYAEVLDITSYLNANFGLGRVINLFSELPASEGVIFDKNNVADNVYGLVGYYVKTSAPYYGYDYNDDTLSYSYSNIYTQGIDIKGYNELYEISYYGTGYAQLLVPADELIQDVANIEMDEETFEVVTLFNDGVEVRIQLQDIVAQNAGLEFSYGSTYDADLTMEVMQAGHKVKLALTNLSIGVNNDGDIVRVTNLSGKLLASAQ